MNENKLVTGIGIVVVCFAIIAGCAAFEEVGELLGVEPTKDAVDENELEKASATGAAIAASTPEPAGGWIAFGASILGGLGVLLKQKRNAKKKLDAATEATVAINAMRKTDARGHALFSAHNKTVLDEILSEDAKVFVANAKALANGDLVAKFKDK